MAKSQHSSRGTKALSPAVAAAAVVLMAGEWILLVAGMRVHEMIVGAASVSASALFLRSVHRCSTVRLKFIPRDVAAGWPLPWYILKDICVITLVLLRDVFTARRAESLYRVSGFATGKDDPRLVARRVLATVYSTTTPNSIVIGIDYEQSRMLFHQIERSAMPKMTQALGAES